MQPQDKPHALLDPPSRTRVVILGAAGRDFYAGSAYAGVGGEQNNQGKGNIPVTYREPDLKVTVLDVPPGGAKAGEFITVSYTVGNIGTRDTRENNWWDRIFLSRDPSLDTGDLQLAEARHWGILKKGDSYTGSATFKLPEDISGDFYLLAFTDSEADYRLAYWPSNIVPERVGRQYRCRLRHFRWWRSSLRCNKIEIPQQRG